MDIKILIERVEMNQNAIIGYYDYFYDEYEYSRIGKGQGEVFVNTPASDVEKFFYNDRICPFCATKLKYVFLGFDSITISTDLYFEGKVLECPHCNLWTYKTRFSDSLDLIDEVHAIYTDTRYYGITKSYNIDDKLLPIEVLISE